MCPALVPNYLHLLNASAKSWKLNYSTLSAHLRFLLLCLFISEMQRAGRCCLCSCVNEPLTIWVCVVERLCHRNVSIRASSTVRIVCVPFHMLPIFKSTGIYYAFPALSRYPAQSTIFLIRLDMPHAQNVQSKCYVLSWLLCCTKRKAHTNAIPLLENRIKCKWNRFHLHRWAFYQITKWWWWW